MRRIGELICPRTCSCLLVAAILFIPTFSRAQCPVLGKQCDYLGYYGCAAPDIQCYECAAAALCVYDCNGSLYEIPGACCYCA